MDEDTAALAAAIGGRVRHERQSRRWTLDQLADVAGVSRRMVVNVEQGAANPSVGTLSGSATRSGSGCPPWSSGLLPVRCGSPATARALSCGAASRVGAGCWWPALSHPSVVDGLDPGPRGPARQRSPRAGHQGTIQVREGTVTVEALRRAVHPRGGRRGRVPRRRSARLRQPGHQAGEVLPGRFEPGVGHGSTQEHGDA